MFDAFLTHFCYCRHLLREHPLDDTDLDAAQQEERPLFPAGLLAPPQL